MNVELGGQGRLGSGNKMDVRLKHYERSTHDLGYIWRSTMAPGTLVPFMKQLVLPGDTFDIDLNSAVLTHPTVGPLFGSMKAQYDVFFCPIRLYQPQLMNNKLGVGLDMSSIKFPTISLVGEANNNSKDIDNSQMNPSCLLSYLGIRGVGRTEVQKARDFNAIPYLAYWDIYKNYYANKQEGYGAYITHDIQSAQNITWIKIRSHVYGDSAALPQNGVGSGSPIHGTDEDQIIIAATGIVAWDTIIETDRGQFTLEQLGLGWYYDNTVAQWKATFNAQNADGGLDLYYWKYVGSNDVVSAKGVVSMFDLNSIDEMREYLMTQVNAASVSINDWTGDEPYSYLLTEQKKRMYSQAGLALKTYQSDLFNNWLNTNSIVGANSISAVSAVSTASGSFTIDQIVLAKKVYDMLNRIAISGGSYDDWIDAAYSHNKYRRIETPVYLGGLSKEIVFQEVVNTAQAPDAPLGQLAGRGTFGDKHKGGKVVAHIDEPGYLIGIVSITPRVDYSQGNDWDTHLKTMADLHVPALDEIGFQDLVTEQMAFWDTHWDGTKWVQNSAGKQPAWLNYMTSVNKCFGNFALPNNEMFMTLNRRYEYFPGDGNFIKDLTTYIDPGKMNFIFAETSIDAQNFWMQIGVKIEARRKMSAKVIPNL